MNFEYLNLDDLKSNNLVLLWLLHLRGYSLVWARDKTMFLIYILLSFGLCFCLLCCLMLLM